jgi:hypothetical protein
MHSSNKTLDTIFENMYKFGSEIDKPITHNARVTWYVTFWQCNKVQNNVVVVVLFIKHI